MVNGPPQADLWFNNLASPFYQGITNFPLNLVLAQPLQLTGHTPRTIFPSQGRIIKSTNT